MIGVDRKIIEHSLNIILGNARIKQKKRGQAGDRNKAINDDVAKLVDTGILRQEIFVTWIANPITVKKHNGLWKMCINYSDIFNTGPKTTFVSQR